MTAPIMVTDLVARPAAQASRRPSSDSGTAFQSALDAQSAAPAEGTRSAASPSTADGTAADHRSTIEQHAGRTSRGDGDGVDVVGRGAQRERAGSDDTTATPAGSDTAGAPAGPSLEQVPGAAGLPSATPAVVAPPASDPTGSAQAAAPTASSAVAAATAAAGAAPATGPAAPAATGAPSAATGAPWPRPVGKRAAAEPDAPTQAAALSVGQAIVGQATVAQATAAAAAAVAARPGAPGAGASPSADAAAAAAPGAAGEATGPATGSASVAAGPQVPAAAVDSAAAAPEPPAAPSDGTPAARATAGAAPAGRPVPIPDGGATVPAPSLPAGVRIRHVAPLGPGADDDRPAPVPPGAGASAAPAGGAVAPQQPALQPVAPVAAAAPVAPAQPASDPPLAAQLVPPIAALAAAGNGEHVVIVRVTPENLGTVTVRAHVADGSMRVELFAAPHARDALTAMLPDLRRDLAGSGSTSEATLGLGTGDAPQGGSRGSERGDGAPRWDRPRPAPPSLPDLPTRSPWRGAPAAGRLDVLA